MFTKARLTLTGWYVLIIMLISILFSVAVYQRTASEVERSLRRQIFRTLPGVIPPRFPTELPDFENQIFAEAKRHIVYELLLLNMGILVASGIAAYFLSGKTLKPIEQMMDEQKRFVADASHELRTPLTAMKTEIEVALRDQNLEITQAREMLMSNLEEVDKMQSLSDHLLTLSRYQDTKIKYKFIPSSLTRLIKIAMENVKIIADRKNITISYQGNDIRGEVVATGIITLVTILLDNAIKYSPQNGKVNIELKSEPSYAIIRIKDSGVGIKASEMPYIFDRFYRADGSRNKNQTDGYGLGLSIAKSITGLHNGKIWAESPAGCGTIFFVKIPLKRAINLI